jgi:alkylhydroperoxidase family enzyme
MIAMLFQPLIGSGATAGEDHAIAEALSTSAAWERLPALRSGERGQELPLWARMVASRQPVTAAALLELDLAHRTRGPVPAGLRAALRYAAAAANRCPMGQSIALADAKRAGLDADRLSSLERGDTQGWSEPEQRALAFARKMSLASSKVTDSEFAELVRDYGPHATAAFVLHLAHANFQDRLFHCLGIAGRGEDLPPLAVAFEPSKQMHRMTAPALIEPAPLKSRSIAAGAPGNASDEPGQLQTWQDRLEFQRARATRLPVPTAEEVERQLPPGTVKPMRIVWNLICQGYAPELAIPWEMLMRANASEMSPLVNRVFAVGMFWVITKTIDCPYCMGHCEMNWEVAGLNRDQILERSQILSGDDWTAFPAAEQTGFAFARKLTQSPWEITAADVGALIKAFGPDPAFAVMMYACRCNYMTRISNGFQLTLERDNVFWEYFGIQPPKAARGDSESKP